VKLWVDTTAATSGEALFGLPPLERLRRSLDQLERRRRRFDPSQADEATGRAIHALNKEMIAAGVRKFACGLGSAKSLRGQTDGGVLITDGPYLETKEHIGGFWILECADMDEAVAWARKGVDATRGQVEVREIFFSPSPD